MTAPSTICCVLILNPIGSFALFHHIVCDYICFTVLFHRRVVYIRIKGEVLHEWNWFKHPSTGRPPLPHYHLPSSPPSSFPTDRFKAVLLLQVFCMCVCGFIFGYRIVLICSLSFLLLVPREGCASRFWYSLSIFTCILSRAMDKKYL